MRKFATGMAALALVSAPLAIVQAQTAPTIPTTPSTPAEMSASTTGFIRQQAPGEHLANAIIGSKVYNAEGKQSGEIANLLLDANGKLTGAVVSFGGFLGIGEKMVAVPWDRLAAQPAKQGGYSLPMTEEELKAAPPFTSLADAAQDASRSMAPAPGAMPAPAPVTPAQ